MYEEVNTRCNLPAQIDIEATQGMEYEFLCVTKGGGSANKTYLYQETKAILNPATLVPFLVEKMKTLGTAACPPYHIAFVIGGTSAEKNLLTVKLASTRFYDNLPTTGNEYGRAFRDVELEEVSKKLTVSVWGHSLVVNIMLTMYASSVCLVTVLLVRWVGCFLLC